MDQHDGPRAPARCPVQPSLHLEPVNGCPREVLGRGQLSRLQRDALPESGETGRGLGSFCGIEEHEVHGVPGVVVQPDPALSAGRGERDRITRGHVRAFFGPGYRVEQRRPDLRPHYLHHDNGTAVGGYSVLRCAPDRPAASARSLRPTPSLRCVSVSAEEDPPPIREPRSIDLDPGTEVEDLAVVAAFDVHEPDLQSRRVDVVAVVENMVTRRVELGRVDVAPPRTGQYFALAASEVVAVDPGLLYLLPGLYVHVRPVDEPPPVHLPAPDVVAGRFFGERLITPGSSSPTLKSRVRSSPSLSCPTTTARLSGVQDATSVSSAVSVRRMGSAEPSVGAANTSAAGPSRDQLHATQRPSGETCGPCSTGTESRASSRLSGFTTEAYYLFLDRPGTVGSAPADRIGPGEETLKPEA